MSATDWQDVSKPKRAPTSRNKPYRVETTSDGRRSYHCDVCRVKSGSRIDIEVSLGLILEWIESL